MSIVKNLVPNYLCIAALVAAMCFYCLPQAQASGITIQCENYVGNSPLKLDSATYKNELGQSFTVTKFKYYISNISFFNQAGKEIHFGDYHLVDEETPESKRIELNAITMDNIAYLHFTIGVDSTHNCSGAQTGALDPANAMFWAWNTGYIFLKMEGKSSASKSAGHSLEFHIGGYKAPNNCIRDVTLELPIPIKVSNDSKPTIYLKADLLELFKTPTNIDFSKTSSVTDFHGASTIADNYNDLFSILKTEP